MTKEDLEQWQKWAADLRTAAGQFAENRALDAVTRKKYVDTIETYSKLVLANIYEGTLSPAKAKIMMYTLRTEVLAASRENLTQGGQFISKLLKQDSPSLEALEVKYAAKLKKELAAAGRHVSEEERFALVCERIVQAGGRDRGWVTALAGPLARAARLAHTLTWMVFIYQVYAAKGHRVDTAARGIFAWGAAAAGAEMGALVCAETGPGAGICAIVGGIIGGFGGEYLYDLAKIGVKQLLDPRHGAWIPRPRTSYDLIRHR